MSRTILTAGGVALLIFAAGCGPEPSAAAATCFEEFTQQYEWDDAGLALGKLRQACQGRRIDGDPGPQGKSGGTVRIAYSGDKVLLVQEDRLWVPSAQPAAPGTCMRIEQVWTRDTKLQLGRTLHHTHEATGAEAESETEELEPDEAVTLITQKLPSPRDPSFHSGGDKTAFGQRCTVTSAGEKTTFFGHSTTLCTIPLESSTRCRAGTLIQPLEVTLSRPADDQVIYRGRTTDLHVGARGAIVPADTFKLAK